MLTLADAILKEDLRAVESFVRYGEDVNQVDEYGFRPLIEAAIVNNIDLCNFLLDHGADPNLPDLTGGTALQWAAENNNLTLAQILLRKGADPNAYNFAGQPVIVMPTLRRQKEIKKLLMQRGADQVFAQDYINVKLLGHLFELVGMAEIVSPKNQFVDVDFEGFFLEATVSMIADALRQFLNHFAARELRRFAGLGYYIVEILQRASELIKYQHYQTDLKKHRAHIDQLIATNEPLVIPVGYEGHAISFIKYQNIWVKCDRREDSRLYDNIMFYEIGNTKALSPGFIRKLLYVKQSDDFINTDLDEILQLTPLTELKIEAQVSGNCSWANIEALIPSIFFLVLMQSNQQTKDLAHFKTLAINYFHRWREWNKDRSINYCIQSFVDSDPIRKATKAEILAAILFQRCDTRDIKDRERIEKILHLLIDSPYAYILQNYVKVYYYESNTEEGKRFYQLLKEYDYLK